MSEVSVAFALLRASTQLVEAIQRHLAAAGFQDVRPAHGFVFVRVSKGAATVADIASYLGVTKQAASQLVDHLVERGYVVRSPHARDRRSSLLALTPRGRACTDAAEAAAAIAIAAWRRQVGGARFSTFSAALGTMITPGPLRPSW